MTKNWLVTIVNFEANALGQSNWSLEANTLGHDWFVVLLGFFWGEGGCCYDLHQLGLGSLQS